MKIEARPLVAIPDLQNILDCHDHLDVYCDSQACSYRKRLRTEHLERLVERHGHDLPLPTLRSMFQCPECGHKQATITRNPNCQEYNAEPGTQFVSHRS